MMDLFLSVNDWTRHILGRVKRLPEWSHLSDRQNARHVYELYVVAFGSRIKIFVKFPDDRIVLSCYYAIFLTF